MKAKYLSLVASIVVACMLLTACPSYTETLLNLVVNGTVSAIKLAAAIKGTPVDQGLINEVSVIGSNAISAYSDWNKANNDLKPGLWPRVNETLTIVETRIPAILNSLGVVDPSYLAVIDFVISEVQSIGNTVNPQNRVSAVHSPRPLPTPAKNGKDFKKQYNQRMVAAGHPELEIQ